MSAYEVQIICTMTFINGICSSMGIYFSYLLIRFPGAREMALRFIQNDDSKSEWQDLKNFVFLMVGLIILLFALNITGILLYNKMFEWPPVSFNTGIYAISFTFLGLAWRKSIKMFHVDEK
jgi:hypothetical protein